MKVLYFKEDLNGVTEYYYNIILAALSKLGYESERLEACTFKVAKDIPNKVLILATSLKAFFILYLTGHRNLIYWYQGVAPEENYVLLKKKWRYWLYSFLEKKSLKTVKYKIGVSKYLFEHYERKYNIKLNWDEIFIMPCFNSEFKEASFLIPNKYDNNVFCYAGSTRAWQGLDNILSLYAEIEKKRGEVFLKIYSRDIDEVKRLAREAGIKNYSVDCVPQEKIDEALSGCKFGFVIREDNVINNVATPTKLGTYLANGIIPIYSSAIHAYRDLADDYKYLCCVNNDNTAIDRIMSYMDKTISPEDINKEYHKLFDGYFNKGSYIKGLVEFLK